MNNLILSLLLVLVCGWSQAANVFVRDGGTCTSNCNDWNNAFDQLSSAETAAARGDTIYVADGTYTGVTFNTAASGTTLITVKKCTASDHGTETGYVATYCDGQAVLSGTLSFTSSYWTLDGQYRNENNLKDALAYGFAATNIRTSIFDGPPCGDNITVKYIKLETGGPSSGEVIYLGGFASGDAGCNNWYIGYSYLFNSQLVQLPGADNLTFEHNYQYQTWSKECIRGQVSALNMIVRFNVFENCCRDDDNPGGGCTAEVALFDHDPNPETRYNGFRAYGNVTWKHMAQGKSDASIFAEATDCLIYNNTVMDDGTGQGKFSCISGGSSAIRNNITYFPNGMTSGCLATTCDNNSNYTSSPPLVNTATGDFHLTAALAGVSLASPYNVDVDGVTRGGDGTWDRGAFEFVEGGGGGGAIGSGRMRLR